MYIKNNYNKICTPTHILNCSVEVCCLQTTPLNFRNLQGF